MDVCGGVLLWERKRRDKVWMCVGVFLWESKSTDNEKEVVDFHEKNFLPLRKKRREKNTKQNKTRQRRRMNSQKLTQA